jgi:hypothetical protein
MHTNYIPLNLTQQVSFDVLMEKGVLFNRVRVAFGLYPQLSA